MAWCCCVDITEEIFCIHSQPIDLASLSDTHVRFKLLICLQIFKNMIFTNQFGSLFMGVVPSWRNKKVNFLGMDWSYEIAIICKGYEVCLEAGLQTLLGTYLQMATGWHGWPWWRNLDKGYLNGGGTLFIQFKITYLLWPKRKN